MSKQITTIHGMGARVGEAQRAVGAQPRGSKARQSAGEGPRDVALQLKPARGTESPKRRRQPCTLGPSRGDGLGGWHPGGPVSSSE